VAELFDDNELMAMLDDVLEAEQAVPAETLAAAEQAFAWRRLDEELAELLFDSADHPARARLRGAGPEPRLVTYQYADLLIECEVGPAVLVGQLLPPAPVTLELMNAAGNRRAVDVDAHGRFVAPLPRPGPIRLRCRQGRQRDVLTPWLLP
jgi:hypothetical protein